MAHSTYFRTFSSSPCLSPKFESCSLDRRRWDFTLCLDLEVCESTLHTTPKRDQSRFKTYVCSRSVCITSIIRLYTIKTFGLTADPTWDNIPITFWTTMETTTALLCSCLPTIRAGLLRLFPQVFGYTTHVSTSTATATKPTITVQKSFVTYSTAKSWPAQKLTSISSLNIRDQEAQYMNNHSEVIQDLELARLNSRRFDTW